MSSHKSKRSAEDILNGLARVFAETNPEAKEKKCAEDELYIDRAMAIVNEWRHRRAMEHAQIKNSRFWKFAGSVKAWLAQKPASNNKTTGAMSVVMVRADLQGAFYRRLDKLTEADLKAQELEDELLKLWTEYGDNEEPAK